MRVSIAMATFNGARFLAEQLHSFTTQTRLPDELVVSDDGSSDETLAILRTFCERSPFPVNILNNDTGLHGVYHNFANALLHATGDVIFFSDQDDVWVPEKVACILSHYEVADCPLAIASNSEQIDAEGRRRGVNTWRDVARLTENRLNSWRVDPIRVFLAYRGINNAHGLVVHRELRDICLHSNTTNEFASQFRTIDAFLFVTAALLNRVAFVYKPLTWHRRHSTNTSTMERKSNFSIAMGHTCSRCENRLTQLKLAIAHLQDHGYSIPPEVARRISSLVRHYERAIDAQKRGLAGIPILVGMAATGSYYRNAKPLRSFIADCVAAIRSWRG